MGESSKWVSVSEGERLTGLSVRTLKRMIQEGRLHSAKTRGGHLRIIRADLDKLLRPATAGGAPGSSVLQNKRERVEELNLIAQELRAKQQIRDLRDEDSQTRSIRESEARSGALEERRALKETELRERELAHQREHARKQEERRGWERQWTNATAEVLSARVPWLSVEQEKTIIAAVSETLKDYGPGDDDVAVDSAIARTVNRVAGPWQADREADEQRAESERQAAQRRESLIEQGMWLFPSAATDTERTSAMSAARTALAGIPLSASAFEMRTAVNAAINDVKKSVEGRLGQERARTETARAEESRKYQELGRQAIENVAKQQRESAKELLITFGELRISSYLRELYDEEEIDQDELNDWRWHDELKTALREKIQNEFSGTESTGVAEELACRIVDEALQG